MEKRPGSPGRGGLEAGWSGGRQVEAAGPSGWLAANRWHGLPVCVGSFRLTRLHAIQNACGAAHARKGTGSRCE